MDNYRSEWVLATLKRRLVEISRKGKDGGIWYANEAAKEMLSMISEIEADAILGTPEVVAQEVDKLLAQDLPGGDTDAVDPLDFSEVK